MRRKCEELGRKKGTENVKSFQRILKSSKVTVYVEKYAKCTLFFRKYVTYAVIA